MYFVALHGFAIGSADSEPMHLEGPPPLSHQHTEQPYVNNSTSADTDEDEELPFDFPSLQSPGPSQSYQLHGAPVTMFVRLHCNFALKYVLCVFINAFHH